MSRYQFYFLICWLVLLSCRKQQNTNTLNHELGYLRGSDETVEICKYNPEESVFPEADSYLRSIAVEIAKSNPMAFSGKFSIEGICIYTQLNYEVNASALVGKNEITFNSGTIRAAPNDAAIAAVLAHELAHLLVQSQHLENLPVDILMNPDWQILNRDHHLKQEELNANFSILLNKQRKSTSDFAAIDERMLSFFNPEQVASLRSILRDTEEYLYTSPHSSQSSFVSEIFKQKYNVPGIQTEERRVSTIRQKELPKTKKDITTVLSEIKTRSEKLVSEIKINKSAEYNAWLKLKIELEAQRQSATQLAESKVKNDLHYEAKLSQLDPSGSRFNFREQEADEVGYELYLRSGFAPSEMSWLSRYDLSDTDREICEKESIATKTPPTRGMVSHPSPCWRWYNLAVTEPELHKVEYSNLYKSATRTSLSSQLQELQELMKNIKDPL